MGILNFKFLILDLVMTEKELRERTKRFALRVIKLVDALPKTTAGIIIGNQLIRCGTSSAANYRAACHGRSKADFIAKLGIAEEEIDESAFWLELIIESGMMHKDLIMPLLNEAYELVSIFVASLKSAKSKIQNLKSKILDNG
jgi:four helix bundle protein